MRAIYLTVLILPFIFSTQQSVAQKDSAIVSGKVNNFSDSAIYLAGKKAVLDKKGEFSFDLFLESGKIIKLKYHSQEINLFVDKRDSIVVFINESEGKDGALFKGDKERVNRFLADQENNWVEFNAYFNKNINRYLARLAEAEYVYKIDSLKNTLLQPLKEFEKQCPKVSQDFIEFYSNDIELYFLSLLADYPPLHYKTTGEKVELSRSVQKRVDAVDLTNTSLLKFEGFKRLIKNYLYLNIKEEVQKTKYESSDNKHLEAGFQIIHNKFGESELHETILFEFLKNHIDNLGIKNIDSQYQYFRAISQDSAYKKHIQLLYEKNEKGRSDHLIEPYKKLENYSLDAHIFQPDNMTTGEKYPLALLFHGGSFFEGKPDWLFNTAKSFASKGWVAAAIEYRIADRHGNKLPDAIADGRSAVSFFRDNAEKYQIDPQKILAMGYSSGATISLALTTLDNSFRLEKANADIDSKPNAAIIYAGLADLKEAGYWWQEGLDQDFISELSPINNAQKAIPPLLIFHGTKDNSVDIKSIREFVANARTVDGNRIQFIELEGAPHMIWRIPYFYKQTVSPQRDFLDSLKWK